jgi:hypothetical protein
MLRPKRISTSTLDPHDEWQQVVACNGTAYAVSDVC